MTSVMALFRQGGVFTKAACASMILFMYVHVRFMLVSLCRWFFFGNLWSDSYIGVGRGQGPKSEIIWNTCQKLSERSWFLNASPKQEGGVPHGVLRIPDYEVHSVLGLLNLYDRCWMCKVASNNLNKYHNYVDLKIKKTKSNPSL